MENILLYPGVEENSYLEYGMTNSEGAKIVTESDTTRKTNSAEFSNSNNRVLDHRGSNKLEATSDITEEFHAVMENIKYEDIKPNIIEINIDPPKSFEKENPKEILKPAQTLVCEKHLPSLCRLCAVPCNNMIDIFGPTILHKSIMEKIQLCLPIMVRKTDTLSKQVCRSCVQKLESTYQFHQTVKQAEKQLRVIHKETSLGLAKQIGIQCQMANSKANLKTGCNEDVIIVKAGHTNSLNKNYQTESNRNENLDIVAAGDSNYIELNEHSNIDKDSGKGSSNCEDEHIDSFMENLNPNHPAAPQTKIPHSAANNPISEAVNSQAGSIFVKLDTGSVNHSRRQSENQYVVRYKNYRRESPKTPYFLRGKKPEKSNRDNDDSFRQSDSFAGQSTNSQIIKCRICEATFSTANECNIHANTHFFTNYYPCCFCDDIFHTESERKEHWLELDMNVWSDKRPESCGSNECERSFTTKLIGKQHTIVRKPRLDNVRRSKEAAKYLDSERSSSSSQQIKKGLVGHNMYLCGICKERMDSDDALEVHMRGCFKHSENYTCIICKKSFKMRFELIFHMQKHARKSLRKCTLCTQYFIYESMLNLHLSRKHSVTQVYRCSICNNSYDTKFARDKHMDTDPHKGDASAMHLAKIFQVS